MDLQLKNKTVFISASGQGIGKASAHAFLAEGARVLINDHNPNRLKKTYQEFKKKFGSHVLSIVGDATDEKVLNEAKSLMLTNWKRVDILIPNLGSGKPKHQNKLDAGEWQRFFDINVKSVLSALNIFVPVMKKQTSGSIVLISSIVGRERTAAPFGYAAAKAALLTLVKNASRELALHTIRINAVVPGNIYFKGGRWEEIVASKPGMVTEYIKKDVPLARFGNPEEIAKAVVFLASPCSAFTTGASLVVDGGETKGF